MVDISNFKTFMGGDAIYVIGVICAFFIYSYWKNGDLQKIAVTLVVYAIIAVLLKGSALLGFLKSILEWFGITGTGL